MNDNKKKEVRKVFKPPWGIQKLELTDTKYGTVAVVKG